MVGYTHCERDRKRYCTHPKDDFSVSVTKSSTIQHLFHIKRALWYMGLIPQKYCAQIQKTPFQSCTVDDDIRMQQHMIMIKRIMYQSISVLVWFTHVWARAARSHTVILTRQESEREHGCVCIVCGREGGRKGRKRERMGGGGGGGWGDDTYILTKDPYIITKDPYIIAKHPYIIAKDSYIITKNPCIIIPRLSLWKDSL